MRSLLLVLGGLIGLTACFGDTQQPAAYRFECDADGDCKDPEKCIEGLCQVPCTAASAKDDCSAEFVTCVNGACANLCELDDASPCPGAQQCIEAPIDVGGGFGGGIDTSNLGVCGVECSADSCPEGEFCLEGICLPLDTGDTTGGTGN